MSFTQFVGTGAIELAPQSNSQPRILSIDESKESITPKEIKKAPSIPGIADMAGGVMAGGVIPTTNTSAYTEAADEMPF